MKPTTTVTTNRIMWGMGEKRGGWEERKETEGFCAVTAGGILCCDGWGGVFCAVMAGGVCSVPGLPPLEQSISWEKHLEVD